VGQDRSQGRARGPWLLGTPQRFAIDRHSGFGGLRPRGGVRHDTVCPDSQGGLQHLTVSAPKDRVQRGGTGRVRREAQGMSDRAPVVASPCGDGTLAAGATQHGAARQGEKSG
jgi:hypothetical protein